MNTHPIFNYDYSLLTFSLVSWEDYLAHLNPGTKVQLPVRTVIFNLSLKDLLVFLSKVKMMEEAAAQTYPDSIPKKNKLKLLC